jgi:hypothetical protein
MKHHPFGRYGFLWVTAAFFLFSLLGHWIFGWFAYLEQQQEHGASADFAGYLVEMSRDTLENWQSEFLQLIWQVGGLAFLLHVGSPQSKEGDDRKEEKIDAILEAVNPKEAERIIAALDEKYPRTY